MSSIIDDLQVWEEDEIQMTNNIKYALLSWEGRGNPTYSIFYLFSVVEVLENVANSLAVNEGIGTEENVTVLLFEGDTSALLVERVSVDF